jgi:hypothetical protein
LGNLLIAAPSWINPIKQSASVHDCDSSLKIAFLIGCKANANTHTSSKKAREHKIDKTDDGRRSVQSDRSYSKINK